VIDVGNVAGSADFAARRRRIHHGAPRGRFSPRLLLLRYLEPWERRSMRSTRVTREKMAAATLPHKDQNPCPPIILSNKLSQSHEVSARITTIGTLAQVLHILRSPQVKPSLGLRSPSRKPNPAPHDQHPTTSPGDVQEKLQLAPQSPTTRPVHLASENSYNANYNTQTSDPSKTVSLRVGALPQTTDRS
jgi:hypothetical protein